jgi:hypothetical protein
VGCLDPSGVSVLLVDTSTYHYKSRRTGQAGLEQRIKEIWQTRVRYGYRRVHVLLRRDCWRFPDQRSRASRRAGRPTGTAPWGDRSKDADYVAQSRWRSQPAIVTKPENSGPRRSNVGSQRKLEQTLLMNEGKLGSRSCPATRCSVPRCGEAGLT